MSKVIEMVTSLLEMDKQIESLKRENQLLTEKINSEKDSCNCEAPKKEDTYIDRLIFEMGLQELYEKIFYSWKTVNATRKENGEVVYTSFEQFIKSGIRDNEIPERISKFECIEKLKPLLMKKYEEQCVKAYDKLLEKEKEESEEDE